MEHEKDGLPITALREIKVLMQLDHPNTIKLLEIVVGKVRTLVEIHADTLPVIG